LDDVCKEMDASEHVREIHPMTINHDHFFSEDKNVLAYRENNLKDLTRVVQSVTKIKVP
jgi:hypothetical protein